VEIAEGKTQKKQKGEPTTAPIGKDPNAITTEKLSFRPSKCHPPSPDRELG
jgi:hypothetical protein